MSSMPGPRSLEETGTHPPQGAAGMRVWPDGTRGVLAATVIAAALGLAVGSRGLDPTPGETIVGAPKLKLDLNTAPPQVLGVLPKVGPSLVREFVRARADRPLTSMEDARRRVRGLGPVTLDQIGPYVRLETVAGLRPDKITSSDGDRPGRRPRAARRKIARAATSTLPQPRLVARSAEP